MSLRIICEFCEAKLSIRADKIGQQLKCPSCRNVVSVPTTTADDDDGVDSSSGERSTDHFPEEGSEGFNFIEEFDLEGLLPAPQHNSEDLSRMPPARKQTSRGKKDKAKATTKEVPGSRTNSRNHCSVCRKQLDPGVRYCTGCGHNNFDTEAAAVDAHLKIQTRMERLTASLGVARLLKIFGRILR